MVGFFGKKLHVTKDMVASAMTDQSNFVITPDMVTPLKVYNRNMTVFAAQTTSDVTLLCWARADGTFMVKKTFW